MLFTMANFTEHEEAFINATIYHVNKDWKGEKGKFADKVGISGSYISFIIGRKKCPIVKKQEVIAKKLGYKNLSDMVEFGKNLTPAVLAGVIPAMQMQSTPEPHPPPVINLQDEADKKHQIVIEGFKDKEMALSINEALVELESLDSDALKDVYQYVIKMKLEPAREKKGLSAIQIQKNGTNQL